MNLKRSVLILLLLLIASIIIGLCFGAVNIMPTDLLLKSNQSILHLRLLRILAGILAGSGLAVSGITLQSILRNPLAEPYLLGTSSGAGLAAVIAIIIGVSRIYMPLIAFIGAILSIIIVYSLGRDRGLIEDKSLILSGVIISVAFSSIIVFLVSLFGNATMHEINWWLWGSLQVYYYKLLLLVSFPVVLGICSTYIFAQDLNAISI